MNRRAFLRTISYAAAGSNVPAGMKAQIGSDSPIAIGLKAPETWKTKLAIRELRSGLHQLNRSWRIVDDSNRATSAIRLDLSIDPSLSGGSEAYLIAVGQDGTNLVGSTEQALFFGVFEFLERQGSVFGLDGTYSPIKPLNQVLRCSRLLEVNVST